MGRKACMTASLVLGFIRRTSRKPFMVAGCAVALCTSAATPVAAAGDTSGGKPTVVLVHGAFADASSWNGVVARLQRRGYRVVAPANPLRSLSSDSDYIASVLDSIKGPIVLVGHSYGGAVISSAAAGNPRVKSLVYVAAQMPDKGESPAALAARFPSALANATTSVPYRAGGISGTDMYIRPDKLHEVFAADLPQSMTNLMAATQRPAAVAAFSEKAKAAAWRSIPSWALVAKQDKSINPDQERFEARRAGSHTVEIDSSHVAMISHPDAVTDLVLQAATAAGSAHTSRVASTAGGG